MAPENLGEAGGSGGRNCTACGSAVMLSPFGSGASLDAPPALDELFRPAAWAAGRRACTALFARWAARSGTNPAGAGCDS